SGVDRISGLPDDILCGVVSRLPARDAARTTALSKHWAGIWRSVPLVLVDAHVLLAHAATARVPAVTAQRKKREKKNPRRAHRSASPSPPLSVFARRAA